MRTQKYSLHIGLDGRTFSVQKRRHPAENIGFIGREYIVTSMSQAHHACRRNPRLECIDSLVVPFLCPASGFLGGKVARTGTGMFVYFTGFIMMAVNCSGIGAALG